MNGSTAANRDPLRKHYELQVHVYRDYLDLAIKLSLFYYAITGALLSLRAAPNYGLEASLPALVVAIPVRPISDCGDLQAGRYAA